MLNGMKPLVSRWLALPLLIGAIASTAPVARWCPMPWDRVPAALYLRCSLFASSAPVRFALASSCSGAASCTKSRPCSQAGQAYCLADPGLSSVWRPLLHAPRNPAAVVAVLVATPVLAAPESAIRRSRGLKPEARPPSVDPANRPPVRGPPMRASFA